MPLPARGMARIAFSQTFGVIMSLLGTQSLVYGVDDLEAAARFYDDFGLVAQHRDANGVDYVLEDGGTVLLRRNDDPDLPPAFTKTPGVRSDIGLFGGLFAAEFPEMKPILVSSMDGVGTKMKVARRAGIWDTVGQDLVNHCINDILVQGARPLFFLDYIAAQALEPAIIEQIEPMITRVRPA